jgi:PAS domain-containing protein
MPNLALLIFYDATHPDFKPTYVNQVFCEFYNVTCEKIIDQACLDSTSIKDILTNCIENDRLITSVEPLTKPHNGTKVIEWVHVPVKDEEGKVIEVMGIGTPLW